MIGQVYVEREPKGAASAVQRLALRLARTHWLDLWDAGG